MSNKLLTGAITLSILLLSSATVYSIPNQRVAVLDPTENPNAPLFGQDDAQRRGQLPDGFQRALVTETYDATGIDLTRNSVPTFVCFETFNITNLAFGFTFDNIGNVGASVRNALGNRIDVEESFLCSLTGAWYFIGTLVGSMDVDFQVWIGSGGLPTAMVASQIINSTALPQDDWYFLDWTPAGLTFTEDFFIVVEPIAGSAADPANDIVQLVSDDATGPPRVSVTRCDLCPGGPWFKNSDFWSIDINFAFDAVVCCEEIPFTDCFLDTNADSYTFIFGLPSTGNCRKGMGMRYESTGFDTLLNAEVSLSSFFSGVDPDGEVVLELLGDDGTGVPDAGNSLSPPLTIGGPGLGADLYPLGAFGWVDYNLGGLVLPPGTVFHMTVRWTGPDPAVTGFGSGLGADDFRPDEGNESNPANVGSVYFPGSAGDPAYPTCIPGVGPGWANYFATFGSAPDFLLDVSRCNDQFIGCELATDYLAVVFRSDFFEDEPFPQAFGSFAAGGDECRIQTIRSHTRGWEAISGLRISIFSDAGGVPGVELYGEDVDSSQFLLPEGNPSGHGLASTVDIFPNGGLGFDVSGAYHIVLTPGYDIADANPNGFYSYRLDDGTDPAATDQSGMSFGAPGNWFPITDIFGGSFNIAIDNFRCCNPFLERVCDPGEDWPTYQHDQARTGATNNALGDANCNLNLVWSANSDQGNGFSGSVIAGDLVYISDDAGFDVRDLATGALVWDQDTDPTVSAEFNLASGVRTQVTVAFVRAGGDWPGGMMTFLGTGLNRDVIGVDALTGAHVWTNTTNSPFPGLHPTTSNIKAIVFDDGFGADILIYAAQKSVYAVIAQTGAPCPFWPAMGSGNPFTMAADNVNAISTDNLGAGEGQIFIPTFSGSIAGNVHALDRFTGLENWNLQQVVGDPGLQAGLNGLPGYINNEGFFSGASVDLTNANSTDVIWVNSFFDANGPREGYLYRVETDGSAYNASNSVRSRRATPIIDENQIYVPAFTKWAAPSYDGGVGIFERKTGSFIGSLDRDGTGDRQLNDNLLTCETGQDDWLISGTELGRLNFYRVGNLNSFQFSRSSTLSGFGGGQWMGGSMNATHVVWTNLGGLTVALAAGDDRPRLEIVAIGASIEVPVEFGTPSGTETDFGPAFSNTGCADLVIDSITLDDVAAPPSGASRIEFSSVSPSLLKKMNNKANQISYAAQLVKIGVMLGEAAEGADPFLSYAVDESFSSSLSFSAASAFPDVVTPGTGQNGTGVTAPLFGVGIPPGETVGITVVIEGPAVTRGPHLFYASIYSNDPDYFFDDPTDVPEIQLNAIGGCLEAFTRIAFGVGGANSTTVFNTANIGFFTGAGANDVEINGFGEGGSGLCGAGLTELFGGLRGWSLTPRRLARTGPSWTTGDDFQGILADPNYCTNTCLPQLRADVLLGMMSSDQGLTYDPVFGDLAATTYIDSAQDYSDGAGGWATDQGFPNKFEPDSTIGLIANETHYGAKDVLALADFRLIRIDVTNRSATDSIVNLVHYAHHDDDIGNLAANSIQGIPNTAGYAYAAVPGLGLGHGYVKVPSGCGLGNDIMRASALDQVTSYDGWEAAMFYDSLYQHARFPQFDSIHFQTNMNTFDGEAGSTRDAASSYYFGRIDLAPGETKSFAIAQFVKVDCENFDPGDDASLLGFADLVNKWAGFHRGDVNNDLNIDLADIIYIANRVAGSEYGAYPFAHLSDVNNDGATDAADVSYMIDFYFGCGPCPVGDWTLALCSTQ